MVPFGLKYIAIIPEPCFIRYVMLKHMVLSRFQHKRDSYEYFGRYFPASALFAAVLEGPEW